MTRAFLPNPFDLSQSGSDNKFSLTTHQVLKEHEWNIGSEQL